MRRGYHPSSSAAAVTRRAFLAAASSRSSCRIICSSVTAGSGDGPPNALASVSATHAPTTDGATVRNDDDAASAPPLPNSLLPWSCCSVDVDASPWQKLRTMPRRRIIQDAMSVPIEIEFFFFTKMSDDDGGQLAVLSQVMPWRQDRRR
jgi:hypothetical protein